MPRPQLARPGLFITGTDTDVGKTAVACAIAVAVRRQQPGIRLGVSKPFASGCRHDREGLVSEDAEALAHYADCRLPLDVINPVRFAAPLAPAVAAEQRGITVDWCQWQRSLEIIDANSDVILLEGVGGILVPLEQRSGAVASTTVLEMISEVGYPALVVAHSGLGTLNHTTMTVRLLEQHGCCIAGLIMNQYDADVSADSSMGSNRIWLEKMTGVPVLAVVPRVDSKNAMPHRGRLVPALSDALATVHWQDIMRQPV